MTTKPTVPENVAFLRTVDAATDRDEEAMSEELLVHFDGKDVPLSEVPKLMYDSMRARPEPAWHVYADISHIRAGLDDVEFGEACRIKAAQGDEIARHWLEHSRIVEYRIFWALVRAAMEVHPDIEHVPGRPDLFRYTGPGRGMPDMPDLADWFQRTHPREAWAIEARHRLKR